jgi:Tol biopolymer transport system component
MSYMRFRTALVAASACLVLSGALAFGGPAFAAYPGANGKIAYERDDGTDSEIYVMNADGTGQTNIINDPAPPGHADDRDPAWSPDGTKIAFSRVGQAPQGEGHPNIYVMNADGTGRVNLTPGANISGQGNTGIEPTWSPDGTAIAYNHSGQIWIMDAATGANKGTMIPSPPGGLEFAPAWSPDGSKIAFMRNTDIWVRSFSGGTLTNLTNTPSPPSSGAERTPDWSANNAKIVYDRAAQIWSMNADGSGQAALTGGIGETGQLPAWSPDGTKIVFDSNGFTAPNGYDIFVMNADGTNETWIDTGTAADLDPSWQPVGVPGGYPRPKGATPVRVSLVPAYTQCTASNRTHGPPLAHPSCNPPALASSQLTVGSPDSNGPAANATGFALYRAAGTPGGVDDSDVTFTFELTDVRHQGSLADYEGELQATTLVRITDRLGGPPGEAATVTDVPLRVPISCTATGDPTSVGATCAATTSFDAITPGAVPEGKRSIWQLGQVQVNDGGPDGLASTTPNTLFAVQGVFVP